MLDTRSRRAPGGGSRACVAGPERRRAPGRWRLPLVLPVLTGALVLLAGCSGTTTGPPHAAGTASAVAAATGSPSSAATPSQGVVRLVVPAGPVQNGNVDPEADWVTAFEQQTGCKIELKNASTDAEALADITRGIGRSYYDGILASPEVAGQLIEAGAVQSLNVQRITGYTQLSPTLRGAPSEVSGTQVYGMPYSWDSYVTGYDAGEVKPAPQSWSSLFAPASAARYGGKITVPDAPVTLALAALYLKSAQPSLGITDPFELTKPQLAAAVRAVTAVRHNIGTFWTQDSQVIGQLGDGQDVLGAVLTHQIVQMARAGLPTAGAPAAGPATAAGPGTAVASVLSWMMTSQAPETDCMYRWLSWSASASVQERVSAWTNTAPANPAACTGAAAADCSEFHETGLATARNLVFDHVPASDCGDGKTGCADYAQWQTGWQSITGEPAPST